MTIQSDDSDGPTFPGIMYPINEDQKFVHGPPGMSLRQYAAIHLSIPDSGLPWLDDMIRKRNRYGVAEMACMSTARSVDEPEQIAANAFKIATAMLLESEKK